MGCLGRGKGGKALPVRAVLAEVKADWLYYKEAFRFPQHNELGGICWLCTATPADIRDCSSNAKWKHERMSHYDVISRMMAQGHTVSTIFGCPYLKNTCFLIDWLHCADQGITADFLGSLFCTLLSKMEGGNKVQRCRSLFRDIQDYYRRNPVDSRLDNLSLSMFMGGQGKAPKLKAKAAEARFLVPYALEAANRLLDATDPVESTIRQCALHLHLCYECLSQEQYDANALKEHCRRYCLLAVALEQHGPEGRWRIKPKMHMWQELCEMTAVNPSSTWLYRDEDFGGTLATYSRRRGGSNNPAATGRAVLLKFAASNPVPCLGKPAA